jgi:hypothetical protein
LPRRRKSVQCRRDVGRSRSQIHSRLPVLRRNGARPRT